MTNALYINANELLPARRVAQPLIAAARGLTGLSSDGQVESILAEAKEQAEEVFAAPTYRINAVRILEARGDQARAREIAVAVGEALRDRRERWT